MHRLLIYLITATFASSGIASGAQSHRVIRITNADSLNPAEVAIAINPKNPDNIIAVSMQRSGLGGLPVSNYAYVTDDGGKRWKTVAAHNPRAIRQGDDAITIDSEGVAHRSYISFDGIRVARPPKAVNGIFVSSSHDGGLNWNHPVAVVDHINTVMPFEDKPWIRTDNTPDSPHRNNLYIAWTRFDEYGSRDPDCKTHIYFSRSTDRGRSFMVPLRISDSAGDCVDSDNTVEGAVPAVGTKGEVYVVWSGLKGLIFDKSTDGGYNFGQDRVIGQNKGGWDIPLPGMERHNGMPVTGVDHSTGARRGTLYINWIDERNGDTDVFVMSSSNGGETWSETVRVNDDPLHNGKAQLFTWMAIDPVDGSVNVVFLDRRDQQGNKMGVTVARSTDGGKTFVNYRINQEPFECDPNLFFGDYIGIDAYNGLVASVFTNCMNDKELALSVALFRFRPGTQDVVE